MIFGDCYLRFVFFSSTAELDVLCMFSVPLLVFITLKITGILSDVPKPLTLDKNLCVLLPCSKIISNFQEIENFFSYFLKCCQQEELCN